MNISNERKTICLGVFLVCLVTLTCGNGWTQDISTSTRTPGQSTVQTQVRRGEVIYVSGNELVVKAEDGEVKHFTVPEKGRFSVDGKSLSVHQLTPGMKLTQTITTTSTPYTVKTVRTISGKVWHVNAPKTVILSLPDGTNKQYNVPSGTMFDVDGRKKTVFELRKGLNISATVITESPEIVSTTTNNVTGRAPLPTPAPIVTPETPVVVGVLLIESQAPATPTPAAQPAQEEAMNRLPKTASNVPLIGMLAMLFISASIGLGTLRRL